MKNLKLKLDALHEELEVLDVESLPLFKGGTGEYYGYDTWAEFLEALENGEVPPGEYSEEGGDDWWNDPEYTGGGGYGSYGGYSGGYGGSSSGPLVNGYCTFNSLSYLAWRFGADVEAGGFLYNFVYQFGTLDFSVVGGEVQAVMTGSLTHFDYFVNEFFSASGYLSSTGQMRTELDNGALLIAAYGNHNVVITGHDGDEFIYWDETQGQSFQIHQSNFTNVRAISGFLGTGSGWHPEVIDTIF